MEQKCELGVIGLAVMGANLAVNTAGKGFPVAVYNRTALRTHQLVTAYPDLPITAAFSLPELAALLSKPRKILLMVQAGQAVDDLLEALLPLLDPGDILIDGGNSYYQDTRRRFAALASRKIRYVGLGVSGGEEGALTGPSLMPGGDSSAWQELQPLLTAIAAQVADRPCCAYLGPDGAGHYVKMVHNGIEYGDMELIAEAYFVMKQVLKIPSMAQSQLFTAWNRGSLSSYLIEITADILSRQDPLTGSPLVEMILDCAGQKGTGKWTVNSALELGVAIPTITAAVFARFLSAARQERLNAAKTLPALPDSGQIPDLSSFTNALADALYASKICAYAQGFALLSAASRNYSWNLPFSEIAALWQGGCIIRARFLENVRAAFRQQPALPNLMLAPYFAEELKRLQPGWRKTVTLCNQLGVPVPAFSASLDYYDTYRQAVLPANLLQAQRDYFGAHTYERTDTAGSFHSDWSALPKLP